MGHGGGDGGLAGARCSWLQRMELCSSCDAFSAFRMRVTCVRTRVFGLERKGEPDEPLRRAETTENKQGRDPK